MTPLHHFGAASAVSIVYAYPLITGAVWGGLLLFPALATAPARHPGWAWLTAVAGRISGTFPRRVTAIALCMAALLGGGLGLIRTETNFLSVFFAEDSAVRQSFDRVDAELGGSGRVEVVLHSGGESFATVARMREVELLADRFTGIPTVSNVDSYLLPLGMTDQAFGGSGRPQTDPALAQELLFLSLSRSETKRDVLSPYLDFSHSGARLSLQTPNLNSPPLQQTIEDVTAIAAASSSDLQTTVTGFGVFIHNLGEQVLRTQAVSILLTLLVIGALLLVQFGLRVGLCGLAANLLPVIATAGLVHGSITPTILPSSSSPASPSACRWMTPSTFCTTTAAPAVAGDGCWRALGRTSRPIVVTTLLFCCGLGVVAVRILLYCGVLPCSLCLAWVCRLLRCWCSCRRHS